LARVYRGKHGADQYLSKNYIDSVLILCNKALSFDNQLSEAYCYRVTYYLAVGKSEQAIEDLDKAIKLTPNDYIAYERNGNYYCWTNVDLVKSIDYLQKALSLNRGENTLPDLLGEVGWVYFCAGFTDKAKIIIRKD
jgi:tetratricopeptide (TPR) repeat protein